MEQRIERLKEFVKYKHYGQKRKYTNEPYYNHLENVALMADEYVALGLEVGLCHDLLEDTNCSPSELAMFLLSIGYSAYETQRIVFMVIELTDVYTNKVDPKYNRSVRKELERKRLSNISEDSQTVKYCDIIDNCSTIFKYDPNFSKIYLKEKQELLSVMDKGDKDLWEEAYDIVN